MKKFFISLFSSILLAGAVSALDLQFRVSPVAMFPTNENYSVGFGGFAQADVDLFGFLTAGLEGTAMIEKPAGLENNISLIGGGVGLGAYYYPLSRLYLGAGGAAGVYSFSTKINSVSQSAADFYWRGYGEAGFRFTPSVTLSATGGFASYMVKGSSPILTGPFAGLSLKFNVSTGKKGSSAFGANLEQDSAAYPLFMSAYRTCPIGMLTLRNNEGAEINNVRVSFRAGRYTASAYESDKISKIKKYGSVDIPLYADFSGEILKFSENGKISGEIVVDYEFLGRKMQSVQNVVLDVYNRNAYQWGNDDALAAFISPDTPEVLELAKYIAGIARNQLYTGMNRNIQFAAAMMEGLRLSGITYSEDKVTPYKEFHKSSDLDSIQYPLQTMNYLSGDYDDLGILLASCLESIGVPTAYFPIDNDFIVLVDLGVKPAAAGNHFTNTDGLLIDDTSVYMPLSMVNFEKGFTASLKAGEEAVKAALSDEEGSYDYYIVDQAWQIYAPAVFTGSGSSFEKPLQSNIEKNTKVAISDYVASELEGVIKKARATGDSNKIGVALIRAGKYAEAKTEFTKAADKGSISAMNNVANIYVLEKNYSAAASQFEKVLKKDPENKTALKGLENAKAKLAL